MIPRPSIILIVAFLPFLIASRSHRHIEQSEGSSTSRVERNLFKEYMSRGLYQCSADYLSTIMEMHKFMKKAIENYLKCEELMRSKDKTYQMTPFESVNEVLKMWKSQDEGNEQGVTTSPIGEEKKEGEIGGLFF